MKYSDHRHDEQIAHAGTKLVPVGGNEEDNAAGEEDATENQRYPSLPCKAGLLRFWFVVRSTRR